MPTYDEMHPEDRRLGPQPETPEEVAERMKEVDNLVEKLRKAERRNATSSSEFGDVLGDIYGGSVISSEGNPNREDGTMVYISTAFNPLTSDQLREIAEYMDKQEWK